MNECISAYPYLNICMYCALSFINVCICVCVENITVASLFNLSPLFFVIECGQIYREDIGKGHCHFSINRRYNIYTH